MGCNCKKKQLVPPQPAQPVQTTAPVKVVLKENISSPIRPPKPLEVHQDEVNRIVNKLNFITSQKQT